MLSVIAMLPLLGVEAVNVSVSPSPSVTPIELSVEVVSSVTVRDFVASPVGASATASIVTVTSCVIDDAEPFSFTVIVNVSVPFTLAFGV